MRQSLASGVVMGLLAALCVPASGEGVAAELSPPPTAWLQVSLTTPVEQPPLHLEDEEDLSGLSLAAGEWGS